jgi:hypothetical protein
MEKTNKEREAELFFYFVKGVFSGPQIRAKLTLEVIKEEFDRIEAL